ncbi:putative MACPF domain-containing protein CAD1/NSL1 [Dioscorea sansibarensis]
MSEAQMEKVIWCLGRGFDVTCDFKAKYCKGEERLVFISEEEKVELFVPGFGTLGKVSADVKCDKGDRIRYQSDVQEFNKMSELFNKRSSLAGKIPSGKLNAAFGFDGGSWAKDASETKCLAIDGYYISLFNLRIDRHPLTLSDHVIKAVPSSWDTKALARFIERFGTHVIVGLSVGGQDVVYVRQDKSSNMASSELKQHLDKLGDQLFTGTCTLPPSYSKSKDHKLKVPEAFNVFQPTLVDNLTSASSKDGITVICSRRGGDPSTSSHCEWLLTVPSMPDVINFTFVPITSLLKGVPGTGFLTHAINLYLRYKPPISDLQYFLDFQCHKDWAPKLNEFPLGPSSNRSKHSPYLHFNFMGPKLRVNTTQVVVGRMPVTGMRLHLEGKKNNKLAVHLQHLTSTPAFLEAQSNKTPVWRGSDDFADERYSEPVKRKKLSNVCTAAVKYDRQWSTTGCSAFIVTGTQLQVKTKDSVSVLHLRLLFSEVPGYTVSQSTWEHCPCSNSQKFGFFSNISTKFSSNIEREKQEKPVIIVDSGVFPNGPPVPVQTQKMLKFVDTSQICMGPQNSPGHWLVTGAKLEVNRGKIGLHVKFSLLTPVSW